MDLEQHKHEHTREAIRRRVDSVTARALLAREITRDRKAAGLT